MKRPYTAVITSRGCPFRCTFCASHNFWKNKYRVRSYKNVVDEIEILVRKYNIKYIGFKDDIFGFNTEWVYRFAEEMKKRRLRVSFSCLLHPFSFKGQRQKALSLLKGIGLDLIVPGLQSVDEKVLRNVNRHPEEPAYLEELIREAKKLSISTVIEFIFGLPGDSEDVFSRNFQYALKVKPHYALFYTFVKLPGSEMEREFRNRSVLDMSERSIREYAKKFQKRFYSNPKIIFQNIAHIMLKNPKWFLTSGKNFSYLLKAVGMQK